MEGLPLGPNYVDLIVIFGLYMEMAHLAIVWQNLILSPDIR